ncbi:MAG: hypothetical protein NTU94_00090 [Planctomycetota bacterium]|nr:hypothetical protein [Planctomycetota bacterium]
MSFDKSAYPAGNNTIHCKGEIEVTHGDLDSPKTPVELTVQAGELAVNARKEKPDEIGAMTFTAFAAPTEILTMDPPLPDAIHPLVLEALERAGYSVVDVRRKKTADVPVLRGELKNFWFSVYTWAMPLFYFGGTIEYRLIVQKPDKTILWEKTFSAIGNSVLSSNEAIRQAMTTLLNKIIAEVQTEEFKSAVRGR